MMASKNQNTQKRKRTEEKQVPQTPKKITKTKRKTEENLRKCVGQKFCGYATERQRREWRKTRGRWPRMRRTSEEDTGLVCRNAQQQRWAFVLVHVAVALRSEVKLYRVFTGYKFCNMPPGSID
jgi:hypothetical protein